MKIFESTCNKLNKILENRPEKQDEFIAKINEIIDKEVFGCNGGLGKFWIIMSVNKMNHIKRIGKLEK